MDSGILSRHTGWLRLLAVELVGDPHRADDLVQDTWLIAVQRPPRQLADDRSMRAWLARVLRNLVRLRHRDGRRRQGRERAHARPEREPSVTETIEQQAARRTLLDAVLELSPPHREVIVMRYFEELPPREIAARLGLSSSAVRSRLHRALAQLRVSLESAQGTGGRNWMLAILPLAGRSLETGTALLQAALATSQGSLLMGTKSKLLGAALLVTAASVAMYSTIDPGIDAETTPHGSQEQLTSDGHAPDATSKRTAVEPERLEVTTPAAAATQGRPRFTGAVRDVAGLSVGGVTVDFELRPYSGDKRVGNKKLAEYTVIAGSDGAFSMIVPERSGYLIAHSPTHVTLLDCAWSTVTEDPVVIVAPRRRYSGVVVHENGSPVVGKRIAFRPDPSLVLGLRPGVPLSTEVAWNTLTDTHGRFDFADIPFSAGTTITMNVAGFQPVQWTVSENSDTAIRLTLLRVRIHDHSIAGKVVFAAGQPVSGATVYFGQSIEHTGADGRFIFARKKPHKGGTLTAAVKGWLPDRVTLVAGQEPEPLVLTIAQRPLTIRGRVVDNRGAPVMDAIVFTLDGQRIPRDGRYGPRQLEDIIDPLKKPGRTQQGRRRPVDAAGRFELTSLLPGSYQVFAMHNRTLQAVSAGKVAAGTENLEVVLSESGSVRRVAGRVLTLSGTPIPGVRLFVGRRTKLGGAQFFAPLVTKGVPATDADGRFAFAALSIEGTYLIPSGGRVRNAERISLDAGTDLARLEIRLPATCKFQVLMSDAGAADAVNVLDGEGRGLRLLVTLGNSARSGPTMPLKKGNSEIIQVDERARTLVLLKGGEEVRRVDLHLDPKKTRIVRL